MIYDDFRNLRISERSPFVYWLCWHVNSCMDCSWFALPDWCYVLCRAWDLNTRIWGNLLIPKSCIRTSHGFPVLVHGNNNRSVWCINFQLIFRKMQLELRGISVQALHSGNIGSHFRKLRDPSIFPNWMWTSGDGFEAHGGSDPDIFDVHELLWCPRNCESPGYIPLYESQCFGVGHSVWSDSSASR